MHEDRLLRREFAERIKRLNVIGSIHIVDALAEEIPPPTIPTYPDKALTSAALIARYSKFLESPLGHAYAEMRLALHTELDFKHRFNVHSRSVPQRYHGVWQDTIAQLVTRLEYTRKAFIPV
jgi:hypothetical protein